MKFRPIAPAIALILGIALPAAAEPLPSPLSPHTAVVYNASIPESKKLAELYAEARAIPEENLIGLICPKDETVDRFMFETTIQKPLRDTFEKRGWWRMAQTNQGPQAQANKIRVMVLSWGVPLRIKWEPPPAERDPETGKPVPQKQDPFATEAASVDSELAVLGLPSAAIKGAINNPYYKARKGILEANIPQILLVGRLDGPSAVVAGERVRDAIEAEREGLWGMAYLDLALKGEGYEEGDDWINAAADLYGEHGIPYRDRPEQIAAPQRLSDVQCDPLLRLAARAPSAG
ncbi:MAG: TIGR03790 family protein [Verrucomicrobiales bacterium]